MLFYIPPSSAKLSGSRNEKKKKNGGHPLEQWITGVNHLRSSRNNGIEYLALNKFRKKDEKIFQGAGKSEDKNIKFKLDIWEE